MKMVKYLVMLLGVYVVMGYGDVYAVPEHTVETFEGSSYIGEYDGKPEYWYYPGDRFDVSVRGRDPDRLRNTYLRFRGYGSTDDQVSQYDYWNDVFDRWDSINSSNIRILGGYKSYETSGLWVRETTFDVLAVTDGRYFTAEVAHRNKNYELTVGEHDNTNYIIVGYLGIDGTAPTFEQDIVEGHQYREGNTYWTRPGVELRVDSRQRDSMSGNARQYMRIHGNGNDVRYYHEFGTAYRHNLSVVNNTFTNTNDISILSVSRQSNDDVGRVYWYVLPETHGHTYDVRYHYRDNIGNRTGVDGGGREYVDGNKSIAVDGQAPTVNFSPGSRGWGNSNVSVNVSVEDSHSGVDAHRYRTEVNGSWGSWSGWSGNASRSVVLSEEGRSRIQVQARDNVGNSRTTTSGYYSVDKTGPSITLSGSNLTNYEQSHRVGVAVADDYSGINDVFYSWSSDESVAGSWSMLTGTGVDTDSGASGEYYLHVRANDNAGNETVEVSSVVRLDNISPDTPELEVPEGWVNEDVNVRIIEGNDSGGSGILRTEYRVRESGGSWSGWSTYNSDLVVNNEGIHEIQARSRDRAGNVSGVSSGIVRLDKTDPEVPEVETPGEWVNERVNVVVVEGEDFGISGIERTEYRIRKSGGNWSGWSTYDNGIEVSDTGIYYVHARSIDRAGNVSGIGSGEVRLDKIAPDVPVVTTPEGWVNEDVYVSIEEGDERGGSGIAYTQYRTREFGGSWSSWFEFGDDVLIDSTGAYSIEARSVDRAGNVSDVGEGEVTLDKENPDVSFEIVGRGINYVEFDIEVDYGLSGKDSGELEKRIFESDWEEIRGNIEDGRLVISGLDYGTYFEFRVIAEDVAGNVYTTDSVDYLSGVGVEDLEEDEMYYGEGRNNVLDIPLLFNVLGDEGVYMRFYVEGRHWGNMNHGNRVELPGLDYITPYEIGFDMVYEKSGGEDKVSERYYMEIQTGVPQVRLEVNREVKVTGFTEVGKEIGIDVTLHGDRYGEARVGYRDIGGEYVYREGIMSSLDSTLDFELPYIVREDTDGDSIDVKVQENRGTGYADWSNYEVVQEVQFDVVLPVVNDLGDTENE